MKLVYITVLWIFVWISSYSQCMHVRNRTNGAATTWQYGVDYATKDTLVFVGNSGNAVVQSVDGGDTWQAASLPSLPSKNFRCVQMVNNKTGYAVILPNFRTTG
jgi:photosystem II stability/assembly factor-like uncharacterized protein